MSHDTTAPAERVLAVASHVTFGYVGNKMVSFVMQALGCDVSAINTVNFSNHTAYKHWTGRKTPPEEIQALYDGLKQVGLNKFEMMLSGYIASKEAVETVGSIGRELKLGAKMSPGSFFWLLDPVMGDEGRLYVSEAIPPAYKALLHDADLIVPNSFEAELLSGVKITDKQTLVQAITILHKDYHVPHVMVTSVRMVMSKTDEGSPQSDTLTVVGSSCRSDFTPRMFSIKVPALPIMFSGTGDMFAALTLVRLREASKAFHVPLDTTVSTDANPNTSPNQPRSASSSRSLLNVQSWQPPDDVEAKDLPLARATERTLASMHAVLSRTAKARDIELASNAGSIAENPQAEASSPSMQEEDDNKAHVRRTTASEVRIVQGVNDIKSPPSQLGERGEGGGGGESVKDAPDSELNLFVAEQVRQ